MGADLLAVLPALVSWVFWGATIALQLGFELYAVATEKRSGALPLTRILRDRLMRRHTWAKLGGLLLLTWLWVHFITPLNW